MRTTRRRGVALTIMLALIVAQNLAGTITTLQGAESVRQAMPDLPVWVVWASVACGVLNVASALALFAWRRWGFSGLCVGYAVLVALGVYSGVDVVGIGVSVIVSFFIIAILFAFLVRGGEASAWAHME